MGVSQTQLQGESGEWEQDQNLKERKKERKKGMSEII